MEQNVSNIECEIMREIYREIDRSEEELAECTIVAAENAIQQVCSKYDL